MRLRTVEDGVFDCEESIFFANQVAMNVVT